MGELGVEVGGDNVELLIHEITEVCSVRNTLMPGVGLGGVLTVWHKFVAAAAGWWCW